MADVQRAGVEHTARRLTLAIDVGGTGLKASVVDEAAQMLTERVRVPTPVGAPPQQIVETPGRHGGAARRVRPRVGRLSRRRARRDGC